MSFILRQSPDGKLLRGTADGQTLVWSELRARWILSPGLLTATRDPVFVERYLDRNGGNIRRAIIDALASNPLSTDFLLPTGSFVFDGIFSQLQGFRNRLNFIGQGTHLYRDVQGQDTGAIIFFFRNDYGPGHADRITFRGIRFSLFNARTSFFGYAIGLAAASRCAIIDCEFDCTMVASATSGKQRWGCAFFGASSPGTDGGCDNWIRDVLLTNAQFQGCGAGRSTRNLRLYGVTANDCNDLAISVCSTGLDQAIDNVRIENVVCYGVIGSGVILAGQDGNKPGETLGLVRNVTISNLSLSGARADDLDFAFGATVLFYGGRVTENIVLDVGAAHLDDNPVGQSFGLNIGAAPEAVSWDGLTISNWQFGVVNSTDPTEQIVIDVPVLDSLTISNVKCKGPRGFRLVNCDKITIVNVTMDAGGIIISAKNRNLTQIALSNVLLNKTSGFLPALWFNTGAGTTPHDITGVVVDNAVLGSQVEGLRCTLLGGKASLQLTNVNNLSGTPFNAETVAGIAKSTNLLGVNLTTLLSVQVPELAAGVVGYATCSTANTRLSPLGINAPLLGNPTVRLAAPGPGGGFLHPRVSALDTIECAFVGPLSAATVAFSFWTP